MVKVKRDMSFKKTDYWYSKSLDEMTAEEWESLCDRCCRCCLNKIEDEESGEYFYTNVACSLLDLENLRCKDYDNRQTKKDDCLRLTPETVRNVAWLPSTCAYRLITEGKNLEWWHPLISGDAATVRKAGISVHGRIVSEENVHPEELDDHVIDWVLI